MDKDINAVFDDILLSEENITRKAYEEGVEKGKLEGNPEGYHLGYHRGAEIGAELGYFSSVCEKSLCEIEDKTKRIYTLLEKLREEIEAFPKLNVQDEDILGKMDEVRANYKKICALLKINTKFPETDKLSF